MMQALLRVGLDSRKQTVASEKKTLPGDKSFHQHCHCVKAITHLDEYSKLEKATCNHFRDRVLLPTGVYGLHLAETIDRYGG